MTYKIDAERFSFVYRVSSAGLPVAEVERWGTGYWLICCPLCGMLHNLPANVFPAEVFEPRCQLPRTHPGSYSTWIAKFPAVAGQRTVALIYRHHPAEVVVNADEVAA